MDRASVSVDFFIDSKMLLDLQYKVMVRSDKKWGFPLQKISLILKMAMKMKVKFEANITME